MSEDAPFAALLRSSRDLIYRYRLAEPQGFEYVSPSATDITGYTPDEHYADPRLGFKILEPEDLPVLESLVRSLGTGTEPSVMRWRRKDGAMIWTEHNVVPVCDGSGDVIAIEGVARDITDRVHAQEQLLARERELADAQSLVHLGSWEWDVVADVVTWSEELCRIYGISRAEFGETYGDFAQRLHPDDREIVETAIGAAYQSGDPFDFHHRILLPDSSVRWLHARGATVRDEAGAVVRMHGTALDITSQKESEEALARSDMRWRVTMESAPDAVISVDGRGRIVFVNDQGERMFGYERADLLGSPVETLLPPKAARSHVAHRATYMRDRGTRPMGTGVDLAARRRDGTEFPVDISLTTIDTPQGPVVTAFVRDITERKQAEDAARELRDADTRRRQALEINDKVVQGLAAAVYALEAADGLGALRSLHATLDSARQMMTDLLAQRTGGMTIVPGDLIRARPASIGADGPLPPRQAAHKRPSDENATRILLADDTADIRMVLRYSLEQSGAFVVVAEAGNGAEAVALAEKHQPHVVLLDLAMPVMDGLQAIPRLRSVAPEAKIVVLSGYGRGPAEEEALRLGAIAYLEKGKATASLISLLNDVCARSQHVAASSEPMTLEEQLELGPNLEFILSTYSHDLRTFLSVIQGVAGTLRARMDQLSAETAYELLESLIRNADQMQSLIGALSDARRLATEGLQLQAERTDLAALVRETVSDLVLLTQNRQVEVRARAGLTAVVDPVRIRQVMANLLSNAVKFSGPDAPIEVEVLGDDDEVRVIVTDRGTGIDPRHVPRLFQKFSRLSSDRSGLGLGLYISQGIARAHGGQLSLLRSDRSGSTFVLGLPRNVTTATRGRAAIA